MLTAALLGAQPAPISWHAPPAAAPVCSAHLLFRSSAPMVCLPAGSFKFGNAFPGEGYPAEEADAQLAHVSAFAIDATEVTNQEFSEFVSATGHVTGACCPRLPPAWRC